MKIIVHLQGFFTHIHNYVKSDVLEYIYIYIYILMGDVLEFGHAKCLSEVLLRRSTEDQLALV